MMAVQAAIMAMTALPCAYADDSAASPEPSVADLTQTKNKVEAGASYVSQDSWKAGQYNGLQNQGFYGIGNLDLRGGAEYDDGDSARRWHIKGSNLGLENRNISADYGVQGKYRFNFEYDELLRNLNNSYQTPYNGTGTNNLTLPSNWAVPIVPSLSTTNPNARGLSPDVAASSGYSGQSATAPNLLKSGNPALTNPILAADLPAFHNINLYTKREKYEGGFSYNLNSQWEFKTSYTHEDKNGYKPMGTVTRATGGDISAIIPDLIDQSHDQYNASLNYTTQKAFLQAAYYGSMFDNHVGSMRWDNWAKPGNSSVMSSAPSNNFNQFSMTGGYNFTPTTKWVSNGSYARNTQNNTFVNDPSAPFTPVSSLNGLVETTSFNSKLTAKPVKDLNLAAAYKYDDRNNQTPINIYGFNDANEPAGAAIDSNFQNALKSAYPGLASSITGLKVGNLNANRPYSKTVNQVNLDADYRLIGSQWLKVGADWQKIDRNCDGSWISCIDAASTTETTGRGEWRGNLTDDISAKIGYAYSHRAVPNYNENAFLALVPMANVAPSGGTLLPNGTAASAYNTMLFYGLTGYGYQAGLPGTALPAALAKFFPNNNALANAMYLNANRISELIGMRRFNMADRDRNKLRASLNWQATDKLSFQGGVDYSVDDYSNSVYGLTGGQNIGLNVDGTYAFNQDLSFNLFYSFEDIQSKAAGNTYSANSTATTQGGVTGLSDSCSGLTTLAARNQNLKTNGCLNWTSNMTDNVHTIGFSSKRKNLLAGKLELGGDLIFSWARTDNSMSGGTYVNNPLANIGGNTTAAILIPAADLPTVTTQTLNLRLNGKYKINKSSELRLLYSYMHMYSNDYAYSGMQFGGLSGVLPTNEIAPVYNVHAVGLSYLYSF